MKTKQRTFEPAGMGSWGRGAGKPVRKMPRWMMVAGILLVGYGVAMWMRPSDRLCSLFFAVFALACFSPASCMHGSAGGGCRRSAGRRSAGPSRAFGSRGTSRPHRPSTRTGPFSMGIGTRKWSIATRPTGACSRRKKPLLSATRKKRPAWPFRPSGSGIRCGFATIRRVPESACWNPNSARNGNWNWGCPSSCSRWAAPLRRSHGRCGLDGYMGEAMQRGCPNPCAFLPHSLRGGRTADGGRWTGDVGVWSLAQ